jgi:WD repeat-containing protein 76
MWMIQRLTAGRLKPHWQEHPNDGIQKLAVANMARHLDVFDGKGRQVAELRDPRVSAVPAVARLHPSKNWVAGVGSTGKLVLWV